MLCEQCGTRRAEIHLVSVVNGEKRVQHLCRECAGEFLNMNDVTNLMKLSFSVEGLMGIDEAFRELVMPALRSAYANKKNARHICPHCGKELPDSMFEHKDGAEQPEAAAQDAAEDKVMTAVEEMAALEKKMLEAVRAEDYEYAAKLRDRISELRNSNETNGEQNI